MRVLIILRQAEHWLSRQRVSGSSPWGSSKLRRPLSLPWLPPRRAVVLLSPSPFSTNNLIVGKSLQVAIRRW